MLDSKKQGVSYKIRRFGTLSRSSPAGMECVLFFLSEKPRSSILEPETLKARKISQDRAKRIVLLHFNFVEGQTVNQYVGRWVGCRQGEWTIQDNAQSAACTVGVAYGWCTE